MDYKKKYKNALEWARKVMQGKVGFVLDEVLETSLELKISNDERIRKALVELVHDTTGDSLWIDYNVHKEDAIAWLEKQGEKKSVDKVESKFEIGDIITNGKIIGKVDKKENNKYHGWFDYDKDLSVHYADIPDVENWHLWTIQDAKGGDVLIDRTTIFIFKDLLSDGSVMSYCDYDTDSGESDAFCPLSVNLICSKITPATKVQRDLLFQRIHEAGYMWDSESKQLLSLKAEPIDEQKTIEWSEEDENIYQSIMDDTVQENQLDEKQTDWLRNIKYRNFARPQNRWKPSDEQMEALDNFIYAKYPNVEKYEAAVKSLYQDLKKLKG